MSLVWKSSLPAAPGWYWVRTKEGKELCVEVTRTYSGHARFNVNGFTPLVVTTYAAWAGPIPRPKAPSKEQLATVRYKLDGANLQGEGGWGQYEWDFVDRTEMLRRARVHLCGGEDYAGKPWPADSRWVHLFTSRKRNGRWTRQNGERFTAENIDAAIAKLTPAVAEVTA